MLSSRGQLAPPPSITHTGVHYTHTVSLHRRRPHRDARERLPHDALAGGARSVRHRTRREVHPRVVFLGGPERAGAALRVRDNGGGALISPLFFKSPPRARACVWKKPRLKK